MGVLVPPRELGNQNRNTTGSSSHRGDSNHSISRIGNTNSISSSSSWISSSSGSDSGSGSTWVQRGTVCKDVELCYAAALPLACMSSGAGADLMGHINRVL